MLVAHGPFDVHEVTFTPATALNPKCCSNPRVLCPACAAKALAMRVYTANTANIDREDILPSPTINFESES